MRFRQEETYGSGNKHSALQQFEQLSAPMVEYVS
jgi:hypothetical protein